MPIYIKSSHRFPLSIVNCVAVAVVAGAATATKTTTAAAAAPVTMAFIRRPIAASTVQHHHHHHRSHPHLEADIYWQAGYLPICRRPLIR